MYPPQQFVTDVIQPALTAVGLYSKAAEQLLLGTGLQESLLTFTVQQGGGPALGYFQMEPATHDDCWLNYLKYRQQLAQSIVNLLGQQPDASLLATNHQYAAAMCLVRYVRAPATLPAEDDIAGLAAYWKQWYNTPQGAGTADEFLAKWNRYVVPLGMY